MRKSRWKTKARNQDIRFSLGPGTPGPGILASDPDLCPACCAGSIPTLAPALYPSPRGASSPGAALGLRWKLDLQQSLGLGSRHGCGGAPAPVRSTIPCALPVRSAGSAVERTGAWRRGWVSGRGTPPRARVSTGPCYSGPVSEGKAAERGRGQGGHTMLNLASPPPGTSVLLHCSAFLPSFILLNYFSVFCFHSFFPSSILPLGDLPLAISLYSSV